MIDFCLTAFKEDVIALNIDLKWASVITQKGVLCLWDYIKWRQIFDAAYPYMWRRA